MQTLLHLAVDNLDYLVVFSLAGSSLFLFLGVRQAWRRIGQHRSVATEAAPFPAMSRELTYAVSGKGQRHRNDSDQKRDVLAPPSGRAEGGDASAKNGGHSDVGAPNEAIRGSVG